MCNCENPLECSNCSDEVKRWLNEIFDSENQKDLANNCCCCKCKCCTDTEDSEN